MNTQDAIKQYKEHTGDIGDAHFKQIGKNMMDVFTGEGFSVPTRYRLIRGAWTYVTGPKLSAALDRAVKDLD